MMTFDFTNKTVFVTGAASGIGAAQTQAMLDAGAQVFAFDQQESSLQKFQQTFPERFGFYLGDVREKTDLQTAIQQCHALFGTVDILLNTAGVLDDYLPLAETEDALWTRILDTNVKSMFTLTKLLLQELLKNQGTVINMASIAGLVAGGGGIAYTASKHAIVGFTKQLALDYAAKGLHVNALAPGAINTPMNQADFAGDGQMAQWVADETPVKRWAAPEEVAYATLFLASDEARYMQGTILPIDGGWLLK
ncbi:3-oxoacyl-ACP reductase [Enterococcus xiangfangensis]|uniref:3-oxoacyl-ACP reductase n=1 Tax=Enterococcus xiangfangensis TaxID=1296537 RepID=A0ABU3FAL0_9ENTE|nr:3-oxoacyl-ACP reductase [Enterococcus xiangfangensis]MDT2759683.1 3-oxoacyl-ACP reductase [Enterococcus xiangfangensis]NBK08672.1 3-oxoacyl-ACP reductase [Enterococcus asini]